MKWLLIQFCGTDHEVERGPFESAEMAWQHLFGREPSQAEIERHEAARWAVKPAIEYDEATP